MRLVEPQSLDELLKLLEERKGQCFFRGQSPEGRQLNSTLARELRGETLWLPRNYIPLEPLPSLNVNQMHRYHRIIFSSLVPHENMTRHLSARGDPIFEIIRYIQQNPSQPKIINAILNHPTPAIEFSESEEVSLYFSSCKPDCDGAIFSISRLSILTLFSFEEALQDMLQAGDARPCVINPLEKLNDLDDLKPKRQQAIYVFQRDLRCPIDHYLPVEKIIINKTFYSAIKAFLESRGVTEGFVRGE